MYKDPHRRIIFYPCSFRFQENILSRTQPLSNNLYIHHHSISRKNKAAHVKFWSPPINSTHMLPFQKYSP